jgi:hypothetical protein
VTALADDFLTEGFFTEGFFAFIALFAAFFAFFRGLLVFRRLAMKCFPASRAVNGAALVKRVLEGTAAGALGLERLVAAEDAEAVLDFVGAESPAHRTALRGHLLNLLLSRGSRRPPRFARHCRRYF